MPPSAIDPPPPNQAPTHSVLTSPRLVTYSKMLLVGYLIGFAFIWITGPGNRMNETQAKGADFVAFYVASQLVAEGRADEIYDRATLHVGVREIVGDKAGELPIHYPPTYFLVLSPFAYLPYLGAYAVWCALALGAWVGIGIRLKVKGREWWPFLAAPALLSTVYQGQNGWLTALFLALGIMTLQRRPVLAGLILAGLCFKPQFLVMVPFVLLLSRNAKAFISFSLGCLAFGGLSYLLLGPEPWVAFVDNAASPMRYATDGSLALAKMPTLTAFLTSFGTPVPAVSVLQGLWSLTAVVGTCLVVLKTRSASLWLAAVGFGTLTALPFAFPYDLLIGAAAAMLLLRHYEGRGGVWPQRVVCFVILVMPVVLPWLPAQLNIGSMALMGGLFLVWRATRGP